MLYQDYRQKLKGALLLNSYNFMAYMSILLNDGRKVKISVGSRKKKLEIISALEKQRNAIYIAKGESIPELSSTIE